MVLNSNTGYTSVPISVDDLSYRPTEEDLERDAAQKVATGRRGWKTIKGKKEAVWPPHLEAALLKALKLYRPEYVSRQEDKATSRFPKRNQIISDYILEKTGKYRTSKQVASRLQQLRHSCKDKEILEKILCGNATKDTPLTPPTYRTPHNSTISFNPQQDNLPEPALGPKKISILMQDTLWPFPPPIINFSDFPFTSSLTIQLTPLPSQPPGQIFMGDMQNNPLPFLSNFVQFLSPIPLLPQTTFAVYISGNPHPVHIEDAKLQIIPSPNPSSRWLYGIDLVPKFWNQMRASQDAKQFTVLQTLKVPKFCSLARVTDSRHHVSVTYNFTKYRPQPQGRHLKWQPIITCT